MPGVLWGGGRESRPNRMRALLQSAKRDCLYFFLSFFSYKTVNKIPSRLFTLLVLSIVLLM